MGLHYVNGDLVNKRRPGRHAPQIVIYEPTPGGRLKLIGADFLVYRRRVGCERIRVRRSSWDSSFICSTSPQSLRAPGVLHAACLGVEGQSQRRVRELASQRFVRVIRRPNP